MKRAILVLCLLSFAIPAVANETKTIAITRMRGQSEVCYVTVLGNNENWNCI